MPITTRPTEKYAFLFAGTTSINTGDTKSQYREDLKKVYNMLKDYCGYPEDHIWVVSGNEDLSADFPSANYQTIASKAALTTEFADFVSNAKVKEADLGATDLNTALIYCTGEGALVTIDLPDPNTDPTVTGLSIEGSAGEYINGFWMKDQIDADPDFANNCFINIVLDFSQGQGFFDNNYFELGVGTVSALSLCGISQGSIIYSSQTGETCATHEDGSAFTAQWVNAFSFTQLTAGAHIGETADLLDVGEPTDNLLISINKSMQFAIEEGITTTPSYYSWISDPAYLGLPAFLIRDGNQQTPQEAVHESPDIYINALDNDLYEEGDNTVFIAIKNNGTHPVRAFWVGTKHFGSGLGPADEIHIENPVLPASLPAVLKPGDIFTYNYTLTYDPLGATHRCIRARASMDAIVNASLDEWSDWNYTVNDFEAQRNIDPAPASPPPEPPPAPDEANDPPQDPPPEPEPEPEPDPDPDTEQPDQTGGGAESINNIRGAKEHIYQIKNPFKEKRRFLLAFPEFYDKYRELFDIKWFELTEDLRKELSPLKILDKPYKHIPFDIESGENRKILFYLAMKPKVKFKEEIKFPFEILVEKPKKKIANLRIPVIKEFRPTHVPISGLTVALKQAAGTIHASVWNRDKKALPGALLFIRTVNGRQVAVVRTGKSGIIIMRNINPDGYKIFVETDKWHSATKFVNLKEKDELKIDFFEREALPGKPVKVILDRIKILDDKDPLFMGKGEIKFTSLVMPDQNESRKQVVHLPEKGVFRVSDKAGKNEIDLGVTVFDGYASENLAIGLAGKEIDLFGPDDKFRRYFRSFKGNPKDWYGKYQPGDEYLDKENVGDWQVWYRIVRF